MPAAISALVVLAAAVLPDGTNAAIPNGWVAKITVPFLAGQTFDPTKLVFTVTDPGFDNTGAATTRTRTFTGGAVVRKQYVNQAQRLSGQVSTNLEVYISLNDDVYVGSTVACNASTGYYSTSTAGTVTGISNTSTLAYPKPTFAWLNRQQEASPAGAGTLAVECVAYHRHAMLGRQVACIQLTATDAGAHVSATVTAATPSLSAIQTTGQRLEAYKAALSLTALTQADQSTVNARVFPWIGDAASVLDLSTAGVAWGATGTPSPQTLLRFTCDKAGTYGGAFAYVKTGAVGGTVSLTAATARAAPFPTGEAALAGLQVFNNANRGHNDHSGSTVRFMDNAGAAVDHAMGASNATVAGSAWTRMETDPLNAAVVVRVAPSSLAGTASMLAWAMPVFSAAFVAFDGGSARMVSFEQGATITSTGGITAFYQWALIYARNMVFAGTSTPLMPYGGADKHQPALVLGCTGTFGTPQKTAGYAILGCNFSNAIPFEFTPSYTNVLPQDGLILANNIYNGTQEETVLGQSQAYARGLALVQNVIERATGGGTMPALKVSADGAVLTLANAVVQHNTIPGAGTGTAADSACRTNFGYTDVDGAVGIQKRIAFAYNIVNQFNIKTDTYATTIFAGAASVLTGRTGNWTIRYGVGNLGNIAMFGDSNGAFAPNQDGANWLGEYWEPGSNPNTGLVGFTNNQTPAMGAGLGGGSYLLTGTSNAAYNRVPAGLAVLAFDLSGLARRNDGTGAAGAYETTQPVAAAGGIARGNGNHIWIGVRVGL